MKTFFVALILGIFVGLFINNYFADPEAYSKIKEAKNKLLDNNATEELEVAEPELSIEKPEAALFEVASKELSSQSEPPVPNSETKPEPLPKPEPPITETEAEAPVEEEPTPAEPEGTTQEKAEQLVEESVEKAAEIAEVVSEKVKEATEEAKPHIEKGIETGIDATIALAIRGQYKLEKRIDSSMLEVSVKDRIATLSGEVPNEATKQLAIEIAVFTKGVDGVEETLEITP